MLDNPKIKTQSSRLPVLAGPTGVGKSEVAFRLAQRLGAEIISADAFQVYRGLEIGTAQPSPEWRAEVVHHLVGMRDPKENWNAVEFAREAEKILRIGERSGKRFLLVGGAGFYLKALIEGAPSGSSPNPEIREMVSGRAGELGNPGLHAWLKTRDPQAAERLHPNDTQRICRALEKTFETSAGKTDYEPLGKAHVRIFGLERSRENLDRILKARTETLWANGLIREAERLSKIPLASDHPLWGAIGYQEAAAQLRGELTETSAKERIFRRTRQYAKRQWTWFKHQHEVEWLNLDGFQDMDEAAGELQKRILAGD